MTIEFNIWIKLLRTILCQIYRVEYNIVYNYYYSIVRPRIEVGIRGVTFRLYGVCAVEYSA
jgi:hypothetical protein